MHVITKFILASTAEHRKKLLATTGLKFTTEAPGDETQVDAETPTERARKRSIFKALSVSGKFPESMVLGADQVLESEECVFSKPDSVASARDQLHKLSGKTHFLRSGWALTVADRVLASDVTSCEIVFRNLRSEEIESYVKKGEWKGACGSYKYEEAGINLMQSVVGEYSAIVGLPLTQILMALRQLKINPLLQPHPPWYL